MMKLKTKSIPSPQIISPGEWIIKECSSNKAGVNIPNKEFLVPFDLSEESIYVRAHEYAHIKWSTEEMASELAKKWGVSMEAVAVCEDGRMAKKLEERNVSIPSSMLAAMNLVSEQAMAMHVMTCAPKWEQVCDTYELDESFRNRIKFVIDALDDLKTASKRFNDLFLFRENNSLTDGFYGSPGEMSIQEPTLQRKFKTFTKRNHSEGFIFASPHRILTDKLCFKQKIKKKFKGTILIDVSGSMGWSEKRLLSLVEKIPAATISCYSGHGAYGDLYIVAKNGFVINELPNFGDMNVIDIPALEWLAQQSFPRIWIGDGGISGVDDSTLADGWRKYFELIVTEYNIVRYGNEQKFLENYK